jgi:RNA polymerase sigma factor (sigma-70 family)
MMNQAGADEVALVIKIAQQDQTALSMLYERYARVLYAVAYKSLNSAEESEEVVLDVFAQVWRTAARYDATKARVDTWLFMITRSRVLDRLRKMQRSSRIASVSASETEIQLVAPGVDPMEVAVVLDRRSQVMAALAQIPVEQRQVIELAYYQGLSHSEIAAQTGLAIGTVKTRVRLGLSKLKMTLGELA